MKGIGGHRADLWRTEAAMFAAFQADAEREGWLCYPETCGHDLLLEAGPTLDPNRWRGVELGDIVVVEGKLRPTFEVLEQAAPPWTRHPYLIVSRRTAADWYAVLVPGAGEAFRLAARAMRILVFTRAPDAPWGPGGVHGDPDERAATGPWAAFLDIETAALPTVLLARAQAAGIAPADLPSWVLKHASAGALSALTGGVVAWAVVDSRGGEDAIVLDAAVASERELLEQLAQRLRGAGQIFTFNGASFDIPFLRARALAVGVPELARILWQSKPWDGRLIDAAGPDWCPRPPGPGGHKGWTLDAAAALFGVTRPPSLPGAEVPAAFYAGRLDEIRAHVLDDVRTLRALVGIWSQGRPA